MWTIKNFSEVYARYEASGLSINQFCSNEQIVRSRFYYWQRKYRKLPGKGVSILNASTKVFDGESGAGFIPVLLASDNCGKSYPLKANHRKERTPSSCEPCSFMEVSYQNGTTVRLRGEKDMELIKALILLSR